jgi:ATP-dependent protease ClpP protease subunit
MSYNLITKKRKYTDSIYKSSLSGKKIKKEDENDEELNDDSLEVSLGGLGGILGKKAKDTKIDRTNNHIYFYSEVNRDSIYELGELMKEIEEENKIMSFKMNIDPVPIYLHINSYGGCIFSAFNAVDMIKACSVPVYSIIEGCAASAGTIMSVVCEKRYIRPNAYMLIHQLSSGCWGKMCEIEDEFTNLKEFMENITNIYRENTSIPRKELNELLKHDLWLNVAKCKKYKLIDDLWTQLS